jgi:predicted nucleotidyltransferase
MNEFKKVKDILSEYINFNECDVYLFGSRMKGTHRPDSDLDVLIVDKSTIQPKIVPVLEEAFENSDLPYKVDIVIKSRISDEFYNHIKPDLVGI